MIKTVLVTGGAGFIGSNLVERLLSEGKKVIVYDNFSTGKRENLEALVEVEIVKGDISKGFYKDLCELSQKFEGIDSIVHLAAQVSVQKSVKDPVFDAEQNYLPIYDLVKFAEESKTLKSIVFASSAAVYGDVTVFPVKESEDCSPLSPYGLHKLMCEKVLFSGANSVSSTALRFFNIYGPKQDPKSPYSGVISIFIDKARSGEAPVVYGSGKQTRDFVYVSNVVDIISAAIEKKDKGFDVFNVGNSKELSVLELAQKICEQEGVDSRGISFEEAREGDIFRSVACNEKVKSSLKDFKEVLIEEGLLKTIRWFKED
ncbi:MAG: NAD-dependent epimerase/dehydratase family protein [Bdellovibrionales bacterium]